MHCTAGRLLVQPDVGFGLVQRVVVIGTSCAGKSTLAQRLATRVHTQCIDLDDLHWEPDWVEAPDEVFRSRVLAATASEQWIVAGNYKQVRDIVWPAADTVIWLDFSFIVVFTRMLRRTVRRIIRKEVLFAGNVEKARMHLKVWSKDSLIHWVVATHWKRRREFTNELSQKRYCHLTVLRFTRPQQVEQWMNCLTRH
ncbi:MAG: adenylate kinase [Ignavibacteria bacterium]|nr:adenylate kinase [Ignavibacteria bacterium]